MVLEIPNFFSIPKLFITVVTLASVHILIFSPISPNAHGQELVGFYANLSDREEVPPANSNASGLAVVLYNNESSELSYLINVTGLEKISQSHIHNGTKGTNGEVVVPLTGNETGEDKHNGSIIFQGDIKEDDLEGPLNDKNMSALIQLMSNESSYVNIHTDKNPDGEIRGQLYMGQIQMDPSGGITGLMVPGGVIGFTGFSIQGGGFSFSPAGGIVFIPYPVNGGPNGGPGSVTDNAGNTIEKTIEKTTTIVDEYVGNVAGVFSETGENAGSLVGKTLFEINENIVQKILDKDDTLVNVEDNDIGNNIGNVNTDESDGDSKDSDDGDSKDSDDGDSKDSDDGDSKDSDDGGDSVTDKVKGLLD